MLLVFASMIRGCLEKLWPGVVEAEGADHPVGIFSHVLREV